MAAAQRKTVELRAFQSYVRNNGLSPGKVRSVLRHDEYTVNELARMSDAFLDAFSPSLAAHSSRNRAAEFLLAKGVYLGPYRSTNLTGATVQTAAPASPPLRTRGFGGYAPFGLRDVERYRSAMNVGSFRSAANATPAYTEAYERARFLYMKGTALLAAIENKDMEGALEAIYGDEWTEFCKTRRSTLSLPVKKAPVKLPEDTNPSPADFQPPKSDGYTRRDDSPGYDQPMS
jgi:hypothetical protein